MKIDKKNRTIHATRGETFAVTNYIKYCVDRKDVETWKIAWKITTSTTLTNPNNNELNQ